MRTDLYAGLARLPGRGWRVAAALSLAGLAALSAAAQTPCAPLSTTPGSLDACFGVNGFVQTDVTGTNAFQSGVVVRVQADGMAIQNDPGSAKVVVLSNVGHSTSIGLTRYFAQ